MQETEVWEDNKGFEGDKGVLYIGGGDESNKGGIRMYRCHGPIGPHGEESCASAYGWWHGSWQEHCPQRHSQWVIHLNSQFLFS